MESGGVGEPEAAQEGQEVERAETYSLAELTIDLLEDLPEDALLAVVGAYSLTPTEQRSTALLSHPPEADLMEVLLSHEGLVVDMPVDLVARGRRVLHRVLAEWEKELRERICPLRATRKLRRAELIAGIAAILAGFLSLGASIIGALAVLLARFHLDELCDGWRAPQPAVELG